MMRFNKMKLKFDAPKMNKLKSQMTGFEAVNCDWMWNYDLKEWTQELQSVKYSYSSHRPCRSVKAFLRMLKSAPKGIEFRLWNKYIGCDVYGIGCE